jgi:hypothetical protein
LTGPDCNTNNVFFFWKLEEFEKERIGNCRNLAPKIGIWNMEGWKLEEVNCIEFHIYSSLIDKHYKKI